MSGLCRTAVGIAPTRLNPVENSYKTLEGNLNLEVNKMTHIKHKFRVGDVLRRIVPIRGNETNQITIKICEDNFYNGYWTYRDENSYRFSEDYLKTNFIHLNGVVKRNNDLYS
jgi:hypothetical protein